MVTDRQTHTHTHTHTHTETHTYTHTHTHTHTHRERERGESERERESATHTHTHNNNNNNIVFHAPIGLLSSLLFGLEFLSIAIKLILQAAVFTAWVDVEGSLSICVAL